MIAVFKSSNRRDRAKPDIYSEAENPAQRYAKNGIAAVFVSPRQ